jgi:hypothetical protein
MLTITLAGTQPSLQVLALNILRQSKGDTQIIMLSSIQAGAHVKGGLSEIYADAPEHYKNWQKKHSSNGKRLLKDKLFAEYLEEEWKRETENNPNIKFITEQLTDIQVQGEKVELTFESGKIVSTDKIVFGSEQSALKETLKNQIRLNGWLDFSQGNWFVLPDGCVLDERDRPSFRFFVLQDPYSHKKMRIVPEIPTQCFLLAKILQGVQVKAEIA